MACTKRAVLNRLSDIFLLLCLRRYFIPLKNFPLTCIKDLYNEKECITFRSIFTFYNRISE